MDSAEQENSVTSVDFAASSDEESLDDISDGRGVVPVCKLKGKVNVGEWERKEGVPWWRPFGIMFALAVMVVVLAVAVPCVPLVLLFGTGRALMIYRRRYRRDPSELKIAIVGGGWSGLQIASRLKQLGVKDIHGFDVHDDFGGTWHSSMHYHDLSCHAAMWSAGFGGFPYSTDKKLMDQRISAKRVQRYIADFAAHTGVRELYQFSTKVTKVDFRTGGCVGAAGGGAQRRRSARITAVDSNTGAKRATDAEYDMVIFASLAALPDKPVLGSEATFQGRIIHTKDMQSGMFSEVTGEGKGRIVVIGGSKSACDMVYSMHAAGVRRDRVTWVYRRPYTFFRYEYFFHDRSLWSTLRGLIALTSWGISMLLPTLGWFVAMCIGYVWTFDGPSTSWPSQWNVFHFGMLDAHQRHVLRNETEQVKGNPVGFTERGVLLESGQEVECETVIWATGYKTGLGVIEYEKDGAPFVMPMEKSLYQHFIVPEYPVLAVSAQLFTTSGPMRAMNSADLAVSHLCVEKELTEKQMLRATSWQFCKQRMESFILFAPKFWQNLILLQVDLILSGVLPWWAVLWQYIQIAVLGQQTPVTMALLPSLKAHHRKRSLSSSAIVPAPPARGEAP